MRLIVSTVVVFSLAALSGPAAAEVAGTARTSPLRPATPYAISPDPARQCETAVDAAEYAARLPSRLLGAISLTETGRVDPATGRVRPWPWTINAEGQGQFFATKQQAIAAVRALNARGVQSVDVGCMQINLFFHPNAFATLDQAFDPRANAVYGARFLTTLHAGGRDWPRAIAAYHSETPALGEPYRLLVMAHWQNSEPHFGTSTFAAYRDFLHNEQAYAAFAPASRVYGAFSPPLTASGQIRPSWLPDAGGLRQKAGSTQPRR